MLRALEPTLYSFENNAHFDKKGFIDRCHDLIKFSIRPPYTLCLDGREGTGKTVIMKKLYEKLRMEGYPVFWFNPWQYSGKKDLSLIFIQHLYMMYQNSMNFNGEHHWKMLPLLLSEGVDLGIWALEKGVFPNSVSIQEDKAVKKTAGAKNMRDNTRQLQVEFFQLVDHISEGSGHKSVIIFFDNLDRLRSVELIKLLNNLKNTFISPHLNAIFVCAMDGDVTRNSITHMCFDGMKQGAADYLSKIFDLTLSLPPSLVEDDFFVSRIRELNIWKGLEEEKHAEILVRMVRGYGECTPLRGMGYMHRIISQFHTFLLFNKDYCFSPENDVIVNLMVLRDASRYLFDRMVEESLDRSLDAMSVCNQIIQRDNLSHLISGWQTNYLLKFYGKGSPFANKYLQEFFKRDMVLA